MGGCKRLGIDVVWKGPADFLYASRISCCEACGAMSRMASAMVRSGKAGRWIETNSNQAVHLGRISVSTCRIGIILSVTNWT